MGTSIQLWTFYTCLEYDILHILPREAMWVKKILIPTTWKQFLCINVLAYLQTSAVSVLIEWPLNIINIMKVRTILRARPGGSQGHVRSSMVYVCQCLSVLCSENDVSLPPPARWKGLFPSFLLFPKSVVRVTRSGLWRYAPGLPEGVAVGGLWSVSDSLSTYNLWFYPVVCTHTFLPSQCQALV